MTIDKTNKAAENAAPPSRKLELRTLPICPNKSFYNPDPAYIRALIEATGLSQRAVAAQIGISERIIRYYVTPDTNKNVKPQKAPYTVQFALERLAAYATEHGA